MGLKEDMAKEMKDKEEMKVVTIQTELVVDDNITVPKIIKMMKYKKYETNRHNYSLDGEGSMRMSTKRTMRGIIK